MKRGWQIASYILALIICIGSTINLVLLISSQNYPLIVVILSVAILLAITFVAILFSFALFINGFRRMIQLIVEHERGREIAFYILGLIFCIESTTYFVLSLISSQNYRLIVAILFILAITINGFRRMIKLIAEPAGEEQNEQEQTF
jgi:hypothetical protein